MADPTPSKPAPSGLSFMSSIAGPYILAVLALIFAYAGYRLRVLAAQGLSDGLATTAPQVAQMATSLAVIFGAFAAVSYYSGRQNRAALAARGKDSGNSDGTP